MIEISVVTPLYGNKATLPELNKRLNSSLSKITDSYEIIYVDDCCPQESWDTVEKICKKNKNCTGIKFSKNFGKQKALLAGLKKASGNWACVMDADLQHRPEEIEKLYNKAQEGYDVVIARRIKRNDSRERTFFAKLYYSFYEYETGIKYDPYICDFSVIKRQVVKEYCKSPNYKCGYIIYLNSINTKKAVVNVNCDKRTKGESKYSYKRRISLGLDYLSSQSDHIFRDILKIGSTITVVWIAALFALIARKIKNIFVRPKKDSTYNIEQVLNDNSKKEL